MRILVIGGCGFVGSNLAIHLREKQNEVVVFDNLVRRGGEQNLSTFRGRGIQFHHGDIRCPEDLAKIKNQQFDVVLECSAQPSAVNYNNPIFDYTNNTNGLMNVLEWSRKHAGGLIFWSTNKVYDGDRCNKLAYFDAGKRLAWSPENPETIGWSSTYGFSEDFPVDGPRHSIYGASKAAADLLLQEWADSFGFPTIINRFSCLAGPRQWGRAEQGWLTWFVIANVIKQPIVLYGFNGKQVRDCLFAPDICSLVEKQIQKLPTHYGSVFNVGGGKDCTVSLTEAIEFLESRMNKFHAIRYGDQRRADQALYISDTRKVCAAFGWSPQTKLEDGLEQIIDWVTSNIDPIRAINSVPESMH